MKKEVIIVLVFLLIPLSSSFDYSEGPKNITLNYVLDGEKGSLNFIVYSGVVDYLQSLPNTISYEENETPSRVDFAIRNINEPIQKEVLLPLVGKIRNLDSDKMNQVRIAISIVQHISYGSSGKNISLPGGLITNYSRYPYEVLYDNEGLCGEKTELLTFLLQELGYETAFFYHEIENHESVGIKCPSKNDFEDTGYCFVETTGPSIMTDDSIVYVGDITLYSIPEVYKISDGESLPKRLKEYRDAKIMGKLRKGKFVFFRQARLRKLNNKYGLIGEYRLG